MGNLVESRHKTLLPSPDLTFKHQQHKKLFLPLYNFQNLRVWTLSGAPSPSIQLELRLLYVSLIFPASFFIFTSTLHLRVEHFEDIFSLSIAQYRLPNWPQSITKILGADQRPCLPLHPPVLQPCVALLPVGPNPRKTRLLLLRTGWLLKWYVPWIQSPLVMSRITEVHPVRDSREGSRFLPVTRFFLQ
jgi:hypothetical protein